MIVRSDIQGNIDRLTTRQQQDVLRYQLLYPIVLDEVAKGDTGSTSCTKGLLWLQRYSHDPKIMPQHIALTASSPAVVSRSALAECMLLRAENLYWALLCLVSCNVVASTNIIALS